GRNSPGEIGSIEFRRCFAHSILSDVDAMSAPLKAVRKQTTGIAAVCLGRSSGGDPPDAVVGQELFLKVPIYRDRWVVRWTVFDLKAIDIEVNQPVRPTDLSYRARRDQHFLSWPPVLRIHVDVTDAPVGVIHEEVLDMPYLAVGGMDMVPGDSRDAAEMRITLVGLSVGATRNGQLCLG